MKAWLKRLHDKMIGYRTVAFGIFVATAPEICDHALGINWSDYVGSHWAPLVGLGIVALRVVTKAPVGVKP